MTVQLSAHLGSLFYCRWRRGTWLPSFESYIQVLCARPAAQPNGGPIGLPYASEIKCARKLDSCPIIYHKSNKASNTRNWIVVFRRTGAKVSGLFGCILANEAMHLISDKKERQGEGPLREESQTVHLERNLKVSECNLQQLAVSDPGGITCILAS
ncbi:predicted protein [Histoplasma capsulatum H143]|uniref:Uncharacterized protein n=1 Tax=Ajellomyces capsulatus (strain H143) TaxID=544712 RepID=C6H2S1_AJECH|nr:predicted protein [Histoplasma capsulatum H143]